mgnify:CR=1 FL=1
MSRRSGKNILSDIDRKAHEMRSSIQDLNTTITKTQNRIDTLYHKEAENYLKLAELIIDLISDNDVVKQISLAEKEIANALKEKQSSRHSFDKSLTTKKEQQEKIEQERTEHSTRI